MAIQKLMMTIIIAVLAYVSYYYWKYLFIISGYGGEHDDLLEFIGDLSEEQQDQENLILFIMKYVMLHINIIIIVVLTGTLVLVGCIIRYYWSHLCIISGYGAKHICSSVFIAGRIDKQQHKEDLNWFFIKYAMVTVNFKDQSVTGSVFGLAKRKAIFRNGLGATLISECMDEQIRAQKFHLAPSLDVNQDNIAWPMGDQIDDDHFPSNINQNLLKDAINNLFIEKNPNKFQIGTRAVVVVYDGKLIAEQYGSGFSRRSKLLGWSMTKSIISALVGILVEDKKLNIDDRAPVPEWNDTSDPRSSITIKNLLQQTSGLNFVEEYHSKSDCIEMLYERGDMAAFAASHPLKDTPGSQFYYTSGNTNIISRIIRQTIGENEYHSFPHRKLFSKLGMNNFVMEVDPSGTFVGSSYSWGTARDWARFGLLYLNQGRYNNEQILSKDWIRQTIAPSNANLGHRHGFQFWLNRSVDQHHLSTRRFPNAPTDMFYAAGTHGQNVFIIPSKKLVVVRLGLTNTANGDYGADSFFKDLLNSIG